MSWLIFNKQIPVAAPKHPIIKTRSTKILFADKVLKETGKYLLNENDRARANAPPPIVWLVIYACILPNLSL